MRASALWRSAIFLSAAALVTTACAGGGAQGGGDGGDGELQLGYVLPETGQLAFLGKPLIESVRLAVSDINDAGGVLGQPIPEIVGGDEAGQVGVAVNSARDVLASGSDAIIGAAASSMSLAIIDHITGSGVVQCSGSNTSATFTGYNDNGFYFRTAPSDNLQAPVLSETITGDGHERIAIAARADDYGRGLLEATTKALKADGAQVVVSETYDPKATNFDQVAQQISGANPDAAVVIGFEEGAQILQAMIEANVGPRQIGVYGTDGLRSADLASLVSPNDPSVIAGIKGTAPTAENDEYGARLKKFAPEVQEMQFAPQVYDCVTIIGLAAEAAQSDDPGVFVTKMNAVTKNGTKCSSFADCKKLLDQGTDIDYDGVSGPLEFVKEGEPGTATFDVYTYGESGKLKTLDTKQGSAD